MGIRSKVTLETETDNSFAHQTVRTVSENCRTIRVWDSRFEESDIEYIEVTEPVYSVLLIRRRSYNESGNDNK